MRQSPVHRPHAEAPARLTRRPDPDGPALEAVERCRIEFVSRGDFVPGRLALPRSPGEGGAPLLLVAHALSDSCAGVDVESLLGWAAEGIAVAAIDLPLHGLRASPKLSARLVEAWRTLAAGGEVDAERWALVEEFARQVTSDWIRCLDALGEEPGIDARRVGFLGLGLGAIVGAWLLAHDVRIRAAAFVWTGANERLGALDPSAWLAREGDVDKLFVRAGHGDLFPAEDTQRVADGATPPKRLVRFDDEAPAPGRPPRLPARAATEIRSFFRETLGV
ncbi:MAG: hypothetical protein H6748_10905 [Spirochaetaceae bacterium]|nr:hypothetical protein [Spirochaetaceae bacterium]